MIKKHISKLLFCSILLNNIYFSSNAASNDTLRRYETLEGEFIDLSDTKIEDITEIEIFGNTVQDSNNLEDIQSVGDLYVDKEGQPILDSQGREQYKIEIESANRIDAIRNGAISYSGQIENYKTSTFTIKTGGFRWTGANSNSFYTQDFGCELGEYFAVEFDGKLIEGNIDDAVGVSASSWSQIVDGFNTKLPLDGKYRAVFKSLTNKVNSRKTSINIYTTNSTTVTNPVTYQIDNLKIYKVDNFDDVYESNKQTILLPYQLMKIGNVKDRLYWDKDKGKYIIEKNIVIKRPVNARSYTFDYTYKDSVDNIYLWQMYYEDGTIGVAKSGQYAIFYNPIMSLRSHGFTDRISAVIKQSAFNELGYANITEDVTRFLKENDTRVAFQAKTPGIIETSITKKIELTTYPEKTYISTVNENGINATLKITIDRIEQVSGEAVDNVVSTPTSNNIALARMFVNLLPESLYKDQLQAQLNEIFSEDMVLDRLSATANLDVYIQSENILMMSLDTNTVTFEDYSGVEELELNNAIGISINSSLPYQLNAYIVGEIINKDKNKILDLDVLNIKDGSEVEYKKFDSINSKLVLLDNVGKGNDISHNIDLKLSGNKAHDADVYKTTIKFEAEQK